MGPEHEHDWQDWETGEPEMLQAVTRQAGSKLEGEPGDTLDGHAYRCSCGMQMIEASNRRTGQSIRVVRQRKGVDIDGGALGGSPGPWMTTTGERDHELPHAELFDQRPADGPQIDPTQPTVEARYRPMQRVRHTLQDWEGRVDQVTWDHDHPERGWRYDVADFDDNRHLDVAQYDLEAVTPLPGCTCGNDSPNVADHFEACAARREIEGPPPCPECGSREKLLKDHAATCPLRATMEGREPQEPPLLQPGEGDPRFDTGHHRQELPDAPEQHRLDLPAEDRPSGVVDLSEEPDIERGERTLRVEFEAGKEEPEVTAITDVTGEEVAERPRIPDNELGYGVPRHPARAWTVGPAVYDQEPGQGSEPIGYQRVSAYLQPLGGSGIPGFGETLIPANCQVILYEDEWQDDDERPRDPTRMTPKTLAEVLAVLTVTSYHFRPHRDALERALDLLLSSPRPRILEMLDAHGGPATTEDQVETARVIARDETREPGDGPVARVWARLRATHADLSLWEVAQALVMGAGFRPGRVEELEAELERARDARSRDAQEVRQVNERADELLRASTENTLVKGAVMDIVGPLADYLEHVKGDLQYSDGTEAVYPPEVRQALDRWATVISAATTTKEDPDA